MHSLEELIGSYEQLIAHLKQRNQPTSHLEAELVAYRAQLARSRQPRETTVQQFLEQRNAERQARSNPLTEQRSYRGH